MQIAMHVILKKLKTETIKILASAKVDLCLCGMCVVLLFTAFENDGFGGIRYCG